MAETPNPDEPLKSSVMTPRQVRILKVVVIVMGVMLIAGFGLVIATIVYQATQLAKPAAAPGADRPQAGRIAPRELGRVGGNLRRLVEREAIPLQAKLISSNMAGDRLVLIFESARGVHVVALDLARWRLEGVAHFEKQVEGQGASRGTARD